MPAQDIAIIGAGIGGLTVALAALQRGHRVRVYEQAPQITLIGGGISIAPNSMQVLMRLGLRPALTRVACWPQHGVIRDGASGDPISTTDFSGFEARFGAPYMQVHRADLHVVLLDACRKLEPDLLVCDKRATDLHDGESRIALRFADGTESASDVVLGADGAKSRVRTILFGERPAQFTGVVAWRGTVEMSALPPESRLTNSNVWTLPNRQIVQHPVCSGRVMHVSGLASEQPWGEESWTARATPDEALGVFEGFSPTVRAILERIPPDACFKYALHDRAPLPTWHRGRVVLLGDAAHPMLPFLAQGASMAIEDGWVLAAALSSGMTRVEDALASYVAIRRERATFVQLGARRAREQLQGYSPQMQRDASPSESILKPESLFGWNPDEATAALELFDVPR